MQKSSTQLTHLHDTHAVVAYNFGAVLAVNPFKDKFFEGWVRLDPSQNRVIARSYRGRNEFHLCNVSDLVWVEAKS